ncbi:DUF2179 domain-containing protein [Bacillus sp. SL00103]
MRMKSDRQYLIKLTVVSQRFQPSEDIPTMTVQFLCVVGQSQFTKLKQVVKAIDASAFVIVMDAKEVLGEGFKRA